MKKSITVNKLLFILFELNAALDSGNHDAVTQDEVGDAAESGKVFDWMRKKFPKADFSLFTEADVEVYNGRIESIWNAYGDGARKFGVRNRGLCLLIAWTAALVQQVVLDKGLELDSM